MRYALAVGLGLLGGVLLNLEIGALKIILAGPSDHSSDSWIMTLAVVAWTLLLAAVCTTMLLFRAQTSLSVFTRGSAMGLLLWATMVPLASGFTSQLRDRAAAHASDDWPFSAFSAANEQNAAESLGTVLTTASVVMMVVCAACFAVALLIQRGRARDLAPSANVLRRTA